jgi:hypothetical protein
MTGQFIGVVFGIQYTESHSYPSCFGGPGCAREYPVRNVDYIVLTNTFIFIHLEILLCAPEEHFLFYSYLIRV